MIKVGIVGATGYTGAELIRLLSAHPKARLWALISRSEAPKKAADVFVGLRGVSDVCFSGADDPKLEQCDAVFFATPHGVAMQKAPRLLDLGIKVIDLGADFRLRCPKTFLQYYRAEHTCVDWLEKAVYGLPEQNRESLKTARLIANPGCYPTTALLGLKPVIDEENASGAPLVEGRVVIDAKSGVSGAGRQASLPLMYGQIHENFSAYGVAGHRHTPEIEQGIRLHLGAKFAHKIRFVPHLVPMMRGMFSTIHIALSPLGASKDWQAIFARAYQNERFVDVLEAGSVPNTQSTRGSNYLRIGVHQGDDELTVCVAQDNLLKGAAGQAVQNMNIAFGFEEFLGLEQAPLCP